MIGRTPSPTHGPSRVDAVVEAMGRAGQGRKGCKVWLAVDDHPKKTPGV